MRRHAFTWIVGSAAALLLVAAPAAALPGLVTGEAIGQLQVDIGDNPGLDLSFAYPAFSLSYDSSGDVLEDGGDIGFTDPGSNQILIGMDIFAYAFSVPLGVVPVSETRGIGRFADGVFATITNTSATSQFVDLSFAAMLSLGFAAEQPFDRVGGQIGFGLQGRGDAAPIDFGYRLDVPVTVGGGASLSDNRTGSARFGLAPGGSYRLSIADFAARIDLHAAGVPEPATWLQLLAGFALVGSTMRLRRCLAALCDAGAT